jgi:hypothetical protein
MCFPSVENAEAMNIDFRKEDLGIERASGQKSGEQRRWVSNPMELRYGGFTVRTTCCANDRDFEVGVDMPCNGASGVFVSTLVGVALVAWGVLS